MVERTAGLDVGELLLPENYFEEYTDVIKPSNETEKGAHEMEGDQLDEERGRDKIKESSKRASGVKKTTGNKPESAERVLTNLVSPSGLCPCSFAHGPVA